MREAGEELAELLDERDAGAHVRVDDAAGDVDRVGHELAREREAHRLRDRDARLLLRLVGRRTEVRRDDDVRQREQRRLARRLRHEHVEAGAGDPLRDERVVQRVLVDEAAAGDVDDEGGRLHLRELLGADHAGGLGRLRHVDR